MIDKKILAYFLTIIVATGAYTIRNLKEQRKLTKRMKRNKAFLAESQVLKEKYQSRPDFGGIEMRDELISLMKKYEL